MIYRHAKRLLDLVFAVVALLLSLPFQAATAGAVAVRLGRPVLFRQVRPGLHGAPFDQALAAVHDGLGCWPWLPSQDALRLLGAVPVAPAESRDDGAQ